MKKQKKNKLERITVFKPAFDKRDKDPKRNFGIGSMVCIMGVKGKKGVVHFSFSTGILLPEIMREYIKNGRAKYEFLSPDYEIYLNKPMGYDVGYHSSKPMFKGQEVHWPNKMVRKDPNLKDPGRNASQEERLKFIKNVRFVKQGKKPPVCEWIDAPCYCDGSAILAEEWLEILIREGSDKIWEMLEEDYETTFGKK